MLLSLIKLIKNKDFNKANLYLLIYSLLKLALITLLKVNLKLAGQKESYKLNIMPFITLK